MHDVSLAFYWHQHQPYYPDDLSGENLMPWVRLHGTKDYWGMAMLLREVPGLRATINLVPSLLKQILAYTESGHVDTHLRVSRIPADGLSEEDMNYLLDNFFMVHPDQMIRPYKRYYELYKKRGLSVDTAQQARKRFSRISQEGTGLDGEREAVAARQATGSAGRGDSAASPTA